MRVIALTVSLAAVLSACAPDGDGRASAPTATAAPSQSTGCTAISTFSRTSFIAADGNRDDVIDEAEYAADVAAAFAGEDRNRDQQLARAELPGAPSDTFDRLDADHNNTLSFNELMRAKLADFQRADANGDGVLSIGEVMRFNAQHGGC